MERGRELGRRIKARYRETREAIEKRFVLQVNSYDEFAQILEREGITTVHASVDKSPEIVTRESEFFDSNPLSSVTEVIGMGYETNYAARTKKDRGVAFQEYYGWVGLGDLGGENGDAVVVRSLLTAQRQLKTLEQRIPGLETKLEGPSGPLSAEQRQRLQDDSYVPSYERQPKPLYHRSLLPIRSLLTVGASDRALFRRHPDLVEKAK